MVKDDELLKSLFGEIGFMPALFMDIYHIP